MKGWRFRGLALAFGVVAIFVNPLVAFATDGKYDYQFFSSNNIVIYDPADTGGGSPGSSTNTLSGSDNEQKIYNYWITAGYSPAQAAGITGSIQGESGFSAFRQQDGA